MLTPRVQGSTHRQKTLGRLFWLMMYLVTACQGVAVTSGVNNLGSHNDHDEFTGLQEPIDAPSEELIMNQTPCKAASDALQKRQFLDWNGLPESCEPSVLLDVPSKPMADLPQVLVGTDFRALKFQMIPWEGYHRVRACFEQGNLVLVDGQHPELTYPLADLLTSLGEPVAKLDWHHGTTPIAGGEWAYPGRGITLYLNTDRDRLLHVAVYQQTDLASYLTRLRLNLEAKRLPLRMPPPGRG